MLKIVSNKAMKVFISYAGRDREVAGELAAQMLDCGFKVWYADNELSPGDNWSLRIGKALEAADAMVVLISPTSMASDSVRKELDYALTSAKFKKRLVPVQIKRTSDVPWILRKSRFIDATKGTVNLGRRVAKALTPARAASAH